MTAPAVLEWPTDAFAAEADGYAAEIVLLLMSPSLWVHRRIETIEFVDAGRLRRRVSVDFTYPDFGQRGRLRVYVPLSLLEKRTLRGFDLRDEAGNALPMLTREQNGALATRMLVAAARRATGGQLGSGLEANLARIAEGSPADALVAFELLEQSAQADSAQARGVWNDPLAFHLAHDLAQQFVLFAVLDLVAHERRVIKFAYEEPVIPDDVDLGERLGFEGSVFGIDAPSLGDAASYHVEVVAPRGLVIEEAALQRDQGSSYATLSTERVVERAHLSSSGQPRGANGYVAVRFRAPPGGPLGWALGIALVIWAALWGGLVLRWFDVEISRSTSSALVAVFPGLVATYVLGREEHALYARLVGRLRFPTLILAIISFTAAATLALDEEGLRVAVWYGLALIATPLTVWVVAAFVQARRALR